METFKSKEAWEAEVSRLSKQTGYYRPKFRAVKIIPAQVVTTVQVKVDL